MYLLPSYAPYVVEGDKEQKEVPISLINPANKIQTL
jgi:hypothetical protein